MEEEYERGRRYVACSVQMPEKKKIFVKTRGWVDKDTWIN